MEGKNITIEVRTRTGQTLCLLLVTDKDAAVLVNVLGDVCPQVASKWKIPDK